MTAAQTAARFDSLSFITPPCNQGQHVETSYAGDLDVLVMRVLDRSNGHFTYYTSPWLDAYYEETIGLNFKPAGDWTEVPVEDSEEHVESDADSDEGD